ncbi:MAG: hypothetical protein KDE04_27325, partial [Anaerolineales bacterium]|nr:hypothetical protein [Anaerolineales bacterium]
LGLAAPVEHPELGQIELLGQAVELSETPFAIERPTPAAGQHTDEVLAEFGLDAAAIDALRANGIID